MNLLAFDLSLTATGWATGEGSGVLEPPKAAARGLPRLAWIRDRVLELAEKRELMILENYAFMAKGRAGISLGELGGCVRLALFEAGRVFVDVPPTSRALFATGRGNARKAEVLATAIRRLGYLGSSDDEADALWLLAMGRAHYGTGGRNDAERRALAGVVWPALGDLSPRSNPGLDGPIGKMSRGKSRGASWCEPGEPGHTDLTGQARVASMVTNDNVAHEHSPTDLERSAGEPAGPRQGGGNLACGPEQGPDGADERDAGGRGANPPSPRGPRRSGAGRGRKPPEGAGPP